MSSRPLDLSSAIADMSAASALKAASRDGAPPATGGSRIAALRASLGGFNPVMGARPLPQKPVSPAAVTPLVVEHDVAVDAGNPAPLVHPTRARPSSKVSRRQPTLSQTLPKQAKEVEDDADEMMVSYSAAFSDDDDFELGL